MSKIDFNKLHINRLFLGSGNPLKITEHVTVIHPTVKEIAELGNGLFCEDVYWAYVGSINSDPYNQMVWLDSKGINYQNVTPYDVFMLKWLEALKDGKEDAIKLMKDSLNFFIQGEHDFILAPVELEDKGSFVIIDQKDQNCIITKEVFNIISGFVTKINNISDKGKINPKGEGARKMLISQKRSEERRQSKNPSNEHFENIGDSVMTTLWGGHGGINIDNYINTPVYMLTCGSNITLKKQNYELIMGGVYAGTIKYESIKSDIESWMK